MRFLNKNFLIIFTLGISSGLPLALILSTLKVFLSEQNFDLTVIGFLSLVAIPYSIKFLFAPIIDSTNLPILSKFFLRRKSWIIFTQIILVFLIYVLGISGQNQNLLMVVISATLLSLFSASQDVAIDGYRIEIFDEKNQAFGASFYIFGYRIGLLISGAFALFLAEKVSWNLVYLAMSFFMIFCIFITLFADEKTYEIKAKYKNFSTWFKEFVVCPLTDFLKKNKWYLILLFIVFF